MALTKIDVNTLSFNPFERMANDWFLVSAGTCDSWNTMTAAWGNVGVMWGKPLATAFVRESRYTHEFIEKNDCFTITFLKDGQKETLGVLGSKSGRDMDKMKDSGLTPLFLDGQPSFDEASLVFVCEKRLVTLLDETMFLKQETLDRWYGDHNMHTMYMGEIISCYMAD